MYGKISNLKMNTYFRLLRFLRPHTGILAVAVLCMAVSTIFDGVSLGMIVPLADRVLTNKGVYISGRIPDFLSGIINRINLTPPSDMLSLIVIFIIATFFLKGIFSFFQSYLMNSVSNRVVMDIRNAIFKKITELSLDYFTTGKTGTIVSRITHDAGIVQNSISEGMADLFYQVFQIFLFGTVAFFIHWKLALISLILLPFIVLPIIKIGRVLRKISTMTQVKMADINSTLFETISGIGIIKAFCMEQSRTRQFNQQSWDYYRFNMKSIKRTVLLGPLTEFIGALGGIFVLWYGGREVINGTLSFGIFIFFLGALLSLTRPFKRLSRIHSINQQALAAAVRIFELLDVKPRVVEEPLAPLLSPIQKGITFENVHFGYDRQSVLTDINLNVYKGEVVAIVGQSGVGKTTLVNLIPRFYDPTQGHILIDGSDIRKVSLKSLREQIGLVTQETVLFHDTVMANIAFGRDNASFDEIVNAAKLANAHQFIVNFADGYNTVIGERGMRLSGGERQRLAIARAIVKNPPILILDEATSQLDSESERLVTEAIEKLMQGRTVFLIAHRLSTIIHAGRIIVLEKGRIIEDGSHSDLIARSGVYRQLYEYQFTPL